MLQFLFTKSPSPTSSTTASPATINLNVSEAGSLMEGSPGTSTQPSPANYITRLYSLIVHSTSYNEVLSKIHILDPNNIDQVELQIEDINGNGEEDPHQQLLSQVLQPSRKRVQEALSIASPNTVTHLVSTSFSHTEDTANLCLLLLQSIYRTQSLYAPFHELLDIFPIDHHSISQSHCNNAFEVFVQFDCDCVKNPFDSYNFQEMNNCFSELKQQLDHNLRKSQSRVRLLHHATTGSAICIIGLVVAVIIAAVAVAAHAFVAIVAALLCTAHFPRGLTKKELAQLAQLEAARRGTYVINKYLDTLQRLVDQLYSAIEGDKRLVRLGLERDGDKYSIEEVVKRVRKNKLNFAHQLMDLKEHICLCFKTVNWARSLLLQEIHLQRTPSS
ncbi:hypothetical protein Pint_02504 [Pistacia integerrima]|uniref:Uncharacterized protein n=1 Tax=Pistacia integerrima TaxID=434235 RepID=A0ACC0ZJD9_9ROSI|nr:hypothetical protein Pint_02504 [Pistacia integerrima]